MTLIKTTMMKEKILICGILPPPYFGHSMIYHTLMKASFKDAFDITFLNMKFWSYEKHKKVTVVKLLKLLQYYFQYIWLIAAKRPKYILYAVSFDKMPLLKDYVFCMTGRLLGRRIVLHDMGQYLKVLYDNGSALQRFCLKSLLRHTTASIVLGEVTRDVYSGFIDRERVISVLGSVEDSRPSGDENVSGPENSRGARVLYFSFLSVSKGVWTGMKAAAEVIERHPNMCFTFAGPFESPQLKKELETFIRDRGLQNKITLTGYIGSDEERTSYYRSADIFIFPTHRDVFGLVLLHALAEAVPIVASIEGAIPEIVKDGENGLLFPKGDHEQLAAKILRLAEDPQLREAIRKHNRTRYLEMFTVEKHGGRMIETFQKIQGLDEKISRRKEASSGAECPLEGQR